MKKLCTLYGNCQMDGCRHFLAKTRMGEEYEFQTFHNWRLMLNEEETAKELLHFAKESDVFIYQPCRGYECKDGTKVPSTDKIITTLASRAKSISYAYQFQTGFFPIIKVGDGWDGWITGEHVKKRLREVIKGHYNGAAGMTIDYYSDHLQFDCARRFIECLAEQARREEETDIKMVPWILQNYRKQRLFLTYNHPTSALFAELAKRIYCVVFDALTDHFDGVRLIDWYGKEIPWTGENEANMNGVMPIHPAVVRELGLEYQPTDNSIEYYRDLLEQMMRELK